MKTIACMSVGISVELNPQKVETSSTKAEEFRTLHLFNSQLLCTVINCLIYGNCPLFEATTSTSKGWEFSPHWPDNHEL